jgi:Asp-tRNA(Asn)/Glu-tRNA(Gln) amidotransferase A subunit family amidase
MAHNFRRDLAQGGDVLSIQLRELLERGGRQTALAYLEATSAVAHYNRLLDDIFNEFDAIVTASAPGEAPVGTATGNPIFCSTWTYLGTPSVSLPLLQGPHGLPIGVQVIGRRGNDARLLRTARWLAGYVSTGAGRKTPSSRRKAANGGGSSKRSRK